MSVIVSRALPDVRDGLKPVHRRVLYAMYDGGYRPDRGFSKSSRVVGDVMGQYHPHGDTAIYDTLVRLGQPWALRYPLVQSQGNFGSPGDDRQAAMRYCLVGDTRIRTASGKIRRIADLVPDAPPNSDTTCRPQGRRPQRRAGRTRRSSSTPARTRPARSDARGLRAHRHARTTRCSASSSSRRPHAPDWRLLGEIEPGDRVVLDRSAPRGVESATTSRRGSEALLLGAFVSEGFVSANASRLQQHRQATTSTGSLAAYDAVVGGPRYVYDRDDQVREPHLTSSTSRTSRVCRAVVLASMIGEAERCETRARSSSGTRAPRSRDRVPAGAVHRRRLVLAACRATRSRSPTRPGALSWRRRCSSCCSSSASSRRVCQLRQGRAQGVSSAIGATRGSSPSASASSVRKQVKLGEIVATLPTRSSSAMSGDSRAIRRRLPSSAGRSPTRAATTPGCKLHNVDRTERWEHRRDELLWAHLRTAEARRGGRAA